MVNIIAIGILANTRAIVGSSAPVKLEISIKVAIPNEFVFQSLQIGSTFSGITETASTASIPRWRRVAKLARIAIDEEEIVKFCAQLDSILSFVEQLSEVNVEGVEPMTSVTPMAMKKRHDVVTDGENADAVLANAPAREDHFFVVPKVVE